MKQIIRNLYRIYPQYFREIITEDMIGEIPVKAGQPAAEFMATAGVKWERWLIWMSWVLQRKSVSEPKRSEFYLGMLFLTKLLLILATKRQPPAMVSESKSEEKAEDPFTGVSDFLKGFGVKQK